MVHVTRGGRRRRLTTENRMTVADRRRQADKGAARAVRPESAPPGGGAALSAASGVIRGREHALRARLAAAAETDTTTADSEMDEAPSPVAAALLDRWWRGQEQRTQNVSRESMERHQNVAARYLRSCWQELRLSKVHFLSHIARIFYTITYCTPGKSESTEQIYTSFPSLHLPRATIHVCPIETNKSCAASRLSEASRRMNL